MPALVALLIEARPEPPLVADLAAPDPAECQRQDDDVYAGGMGSSSGQSELNLCWQAYARSVRSA